MTVSVSPEVFAGLEFLKSSSFEDRYNIPKVVRFLESAGYNSSARWISKNRYEYATGLEEGFSYG